MRPLVTIMLGILFGLVGSIGQSQTKDKKEGWANVPGGTVWLRPGRDAYEHDTGFVRDLQTGQKSLPVTPQSLAHRQPLPNSLSPVPTLAPLSPMNPLPIYLWPQNPYLNSPYQPPYYYGGPQVGPQVYDYGPGNIYANQPPCNNCGAKLGSPGSINGRWTRLQ